jgi:catechol-2,3-dioxygenase
MNELQVGQKSYEMPPQEGITIAHFIVVADIERSARFYEKVFGARILSRGDSKGAPRIPSDREHVALAASCANSRTASGHWCGRTTRRHCRFS